MNSEKAALLKRKSILRHTDGIKKVKAYHKHDSNYPLIVCGGGEYHIEKYEHIKSEYCASKDFYLDDI